MKKPSHKTILNFFGSLIILEIIILIVINYSKIADYFFNEATKYNGELLKFVATAIGGILLFYGLWLNARRTKALEQQNIISERGQVNERFKNAIEHLGSDNPAITLGGIHALHRIAFDDPSYRTIVFNILCSYIRETSSYITNLDKFIGKKGDKKPSIIIQTILDLLFKHDSKSTYVYESLDADLKGVNLEGADLDYADLNCADLRGANLNGARLSKANLQEAFLQNAQLCCAFLIEANLENAYLEDTILEGANLEGANLENAFLLGANLNNAYMKRTNSMGVNLMRATLIAANLSEASLEGADMRETNLVDANFEGANLKEAFLYNTDLSRTNLNKADLSGAYLTITDLNPNYIPPTPTDDIDNHAK